MQAQQGVPPQEPVVALSPAHVTPDQFIDFGMAMGAKLYKLAIQSLNETKYDLNENGNLTFLQLFNDWITESSWEPILTNAL